MITNYDKQIALQNIGYDVEYLETLSGSALTRLWLDEIAKADLIHWVKEKGEYDGVCHVLWLDNTFYGACNIAAYKTSLTDILALYAGEDMTGADSLSVLAASEDDTAQLFVDITDFNADVIDRIYDFVINYKK
jgi:DNA-dependent RNA polymerase auxiliary subunit epsilon